MTVWSRCQLPLLRFAITVSLREREREREMVKRSNKKSSLIIKFSVIVVFFGICSMVNVLNEGTELRGRSLSTSTNQTCESRLREEYDCSELDCQDKVSGMINYLHFSFCDAKSDLVWMLYVVWLLYLLHLLADTADEYFVPVLEHIVEFFKVPPSIAGITFLSFGNGAPDVFSAIVSYAGGGGGDIGLGALLGSGVYVTTVICAVIAFYTPKEKSKLYRRPFLRDIIFYLVILTYMCVLFIAEATITMSLALVFVIIYVAYIIFVILARHIYQTRKMQKRIEDGIARLQSQNSMERSLLSSGNDSESKNSNHIELPKAEDGWGYSGYNSYVLEVANRHHHHQAKAYKPEVLNVARMLSSGVLSHRILEGSNAEDDEDDSSDFRRVSMRGLRSHRSAHVPSKMSAEIMKKSRRNSDVEIRTVKRIDSKMVELEDATHFDLGVTSSIPSKEEEDEKDDDDDDDDDDESSPTTIPEAWNEWKENFGSMKWYSIFLSCSIVILCFPNILLLKTYTHSGMKKFSHLFLHREIFFEVFQFLLPMKKTGIEISSC